MRKGSPSPSSSVLCMDGRRILIDCGIGASRSLVEAGIPITQLDAIFITHLHSDHLLELGPLIYTAWTSGLTETLDVFGPAGIAGYWEHFIKAMSFDHSIRTVDDKRRPLTELIAIHEFHEGKIENKLELEISSFQVEHPPVTDCYALRFEGKQKTAVFSADTCYFPPLATFAKGADILIHEAMLSSGIDALVARLKGAPGLRKHLIASHTMAEDVGKIAAAANVKLLALNHLVPADDPTITHRDWKSAIAENWDGEVIVGQDGLVVPF